MQSQLKSFAVGSLFACAFLGAFTVQTIHAKLEVIVPAYFYPVVNSPWDDLNAATSQVDITAIMNPASGSGSSQDLNYVAAVDSLRTVGGRVVGYVPSTFGARPIADVKADIDNYYAWYNVDGIFIDEMANTGPAEKIFYYQDIYNYVKSKDPNGEVMGNPGTNTLEQYLDFLGGTTADRLFISEAVGSDYATFTPSPWVFNYNRSNFVHLLHSEPSLSTMQGDLNLAVARNAGAIFITDDVLPNPWNTLPTYWQAELDAIVQVNNAILAADFDENGTVDASDFAKWSGGFGAVSGATKFQGDSDGDGDVDGGDFLQWQQQLGQTTIPVSFLSGLEGQSSASSVPEPSCVSLLALGFFCFFAGARQRPMTCNGSPEILSKQN